MRSGYTGLGRALSLLALAVCLQSCDFRSGSAGDTRLTSLDPGDCSLVSAAGDHDALSYRCDGPDRPVFLHFNDGTRLSIQIGMGGPEFGPFSSKREPNWPIQWVGKTDMGGFKPTAAIFRAREPYDDEGPTFLTVVSLASTPCVLGRISGANANEQAISLAKQGQCGPTVAPSRESPAAGRPSVSPQRYRVKFTCLVLGSDGLEPVEFSACINRFAEVSVKRGSERMSLPDDLIQRSSFVLDVGDDDFEAWARQSKGISKVRIDVLDDSRRVVASVTTQGDWNHQWDFAQVSRDDIEQNP